MPDVEVKLNIEAEYKQALAAIAAMGKALEAVQSKADAVKNALGGATSAGNGKTDAGGAESLAALNKANRELAQALLLVNQTAEKAKAAIQSFSELTGTSPDMIESLNQAAAGYERLATLAQTAADAAERFNNAAQPGLSTAELLKQTEAAEKQVKVLQEQAAALQETIAAQQRQLEQLRATEEQVKRNLQVREKEKKEQQLNIAQLDREAQAQEDANYRMELAGQTRLQLAHTIQELNAKLKEAAASKDAEAWEQYSRKLKLANAQMRQLTMQARVSKIALMQQAQVAQNLGQNITTVVSGFSNLGDAAKKGELNLTQMASSFLSLMTAFKAGMGPIGWVMLALQYLQSVLNDSAKAHEREAQALKKIADSDAAAAEAYKNIAAAREQHNKQIEREKSIQSLADYYRDANDKLKDNIKLINEATNAEIARLSITQDQEQFNKTMEKERLGRQLKLGEISNAEYTQKIIELEKSGNIAAGWNKYKIAEEKRKAAENIAVDLESDAESKREDKEEAAKSFKEEFSVSKREVETMRREEERLERDTKEAEEDLEQFYKENTDFFSNLKGGSRELLALGANYGSGVGLALNAMGINMDGASDEFKSQLNKLSEKYNKTVYRRMAFNTKISESLGGRYFDSYLNDMDAAQERLNIITRESESAEKAAKDARAEAENAARVSRATKAEARRNEANQNEAAQSRLENLEIDMAAAATREQNKRILAEAKRTMSEMTTADIASAARYYKKESANEKNAVTRAFLEEMYATYSEGLASRKESRSEKLQIGTDKYLGDKKFTLKEAEEVIKLLKKAIAQKDAEAIEVYKSLLDMGKKMAADKKTVAAIKKQNKTLSR